MSTPITRCPHCLAKLQLKKIPQPGNTVRCPGCRQAFTIGVAPPTEPTQPPAPVRQAAPAPQPPAAFWDEPEEANEEPQQANEEPEEVDEELEDVSEEEEVEEPRSKDARKKKRAKKAKATWQPPRGLLIGLGVLGVVALAVVGVVLLKPFSGREEQLIVAKPTVDYVDPGIFRCKYPEGWKVEVLGDKDHRNVTFRSGSAEFNLRLKHAVSTLEDAALTGRPKFLTDPRAAMSHAHEENKIIAAKEIGGGYEEQGEVDYLMGVCPRSRFVTKGGLFSPKMRGYRMTIVAFPKELSVVCMCSDSDWAKLEPVFDEALSTVQMGN
jgi:hypothetical protein